MIGRLFDGKSILAALTVFWILPTLVFYVIGNEQFSERALFNIDYPIFAFIAITLRFGHRTVVIGLTALTKPVKDFGTPGALRLLNGVL